MLNVTWLRTFVALLREGSFQGAARRLGVAQPTVSLHLKKLEEQVGAQLIERARSGCRPTARAELLRPYAEQMVLLQERAQQALRVDLERVGASSNVGTYLLPPLIRNFLDSGRKGQIDLSITSNPQTVQRLINGEIDIAVTEWWSPISGYRSRSWRYEPLVLIVPPKHELTQYAEATPEIVARFEMLGGEPGSGTGRLLQRYFGEHRMPRVSMQLGNTEAVKEAVKAGLGVSIVLGAAVRKETSNGELISIPLKGLGKDLMVAWQDRSARWSEMPRFVEHLLEPAVSTG